MFGIPSFLVLPVLALAVLVFLALVRHFRQSPETRRIVEETLGDDTPEAAIEEYYAAVARLQRHRATIGLDTALAAEIDSILGNGDHVQS